VHHVYYFVPTSQKKPEEGGDQKEGATGGDEKEGATGGDEKKPEEGEKKQDESAAEKPEEGGKKLEPTPSRKPSRRRTLSFSRRQRRPAPAVVSGPACDSL